MIKRFILPVCFFLLFLCWNETASGQTARNLLSRFSEDDIGRALLPRKAWAPFPKTAVEWQRIVPDSVRQRIVRLAEKEARLPFASIPLSLMMEFKRNGNRSNYESVSFGKRERLMMLILAESFEKKGAFTDRIADGIWSLCEESFWGLPAHFYLQKAGPGAADIEDPVVDLFVAETAVLLALADYLVGEQLDSVSPLLRRRIYLEVDRRLFKPLEQKDVPYNYLGKGSQQAPINNWNPWVISNWMTSLLLLENDEGRRVRELKHAMALLDNYINWVGPDGAIDEGPSYWFSAVGRLFDALAVLESASAGKLTIYKDPFMKTLGAFIYKFHIADDYFISIADASPTIRTDGLLLYRMGKSNGDDTLRRFGVWAFRQAPDILPLLKDFPKPRLLLNLLAYKECALEAGSPPQLKDVWMNSIQLMAARTDNGLYVAAHGGHNAESHNHNDVGDFILYADGQPVIIDVGFGTYTAKTFSKERYEFWYLGSAGHNLPVVNGYQQQAGRSFEAKDVHYLASDKNARLTMDIAAAWPATAGISEWKRTVEADRKKGQVLITDRYKLNSTPSELTQSFMTVCPVNMEKPGRIVFEVADGGKVIMEYDATAWEPQKEMVLTGAADEQKIVDNWRQQPIWRILLVSKKKQPSGRFQYLFRKEK